MVERIETDILFGSLAKRVDKYTYTLKVYFSTSESYKNDDQLILIQPHNIHINNIKYDAFKVDHLFIDTTLIGRKALFTVKTKRDDIVFGDLFKLPFGNGNAVQVPSNATEFLVNFLDPEYKVAV